MNQKASGERLCAPQDVQSEGFEGDGEAHHGHAAHPQASRSHI
jgi:hypothetical protein